MKRIIAFALVLVLALSLVACGGGDPSKAIIGTWKNAGGNSCSFKADGTGSVMVERSTTVSCKWTYDEDAGVWNIDYGYNKDTATIKTGDDGKPVLVWQGGNYTKVG